MRKRIFLILAVLAVFAGTSRAQVAGGAADPQLTNDEDRAFDNYLNGKWMLSVENDPVKAGEYFVKALAIDSMYAPAHFEVANILKSKKDAVKHSRIAYESDPDNDAYISQLSMLYAETGDMENAIEIGKELINKKKNIQRNYTYLASLYMMSKNYKEALACLDTLTARFGESPEIQDFKSDIINSMRPDDELMAKVKGMVADDPENPKFLVLLGNKYLQMRQDSMALQYYNAALNIESDNIHAIVSMFDYYNGKGEKERVAMLAPSIFGSEEVIPFAKITLFNDLFIKDDYYMRTHPALVLEIAQSMAEQYPSNFEVQTLYAQQLIYNRRMGDALELYKDLAEKNVGGLAAYRYVIDIEYFQNNQDSVIRYSNAAMEKYPESMDLMVRIKADALAKKGDRGAAVSLLEKKAKEIESDSIKSLFYAMIGDLYSLDNENKVAIKNYKKAVTLDATNIGALNNYAYMLAEEGKNLAKALSMSEQTIKDEPSNVTFLDTYAWILYKMGRYDEAQQTMSKAIALDTSNNATLLLHYADILYAQGKEALAKIYWKKALEAGEPSSVIEQRIRQIENKK